MSTGFTMHQNRIFSGILGMCKWEMDSRWVCVQGTRTFHPRVFSCTTNHCTQGTDEKVNSA